MTSYIGLPGALVPVSCPASEDVSADRAVSALTPFSGRRVVQLGPRVRRTWSVNWSAEDPQDYAVLDALTRWDTPLSWVGALAQATNVLTPEQSILSHVSSPVRGALDLGDGVWAAQWASGGTVSVTGGHGTPVRAGVPVTVSAWTQRADPATPVQLWFQFLDATGAVLQSITRDGPAGNALQRVSWQLTPPTGAAEVTVVIRFSSIVAAPQITWTPDLRPYSPGRGVHRVVVIPGGESPIIAHRDQVLTSAAYTILEVG